MGAGKVSTPTIPKTKEIKQSPGIASFSLNKAIHTNVHSDNGTSKASDNTTQQTVVEELNNPVTIENLQKVWKQYATTIETDNVRLFSILINNLPKLGDNGSVSLELPSPIQKVEIEKNKESLMLYLKKSLQNSSLNLSIVINEENTTQQEKVFTAADKLKAMMEKNPALAALKQQFNLDLE